MSDKKQELRELIARFLEHLEVERGLSPLTIRNYGFWLTKFSLWLSRQILHPRVSDVTSDTVRAFRVWLARQPGRDHFRLSQTTQSYHVVALRSFLRWCAREDMGALAAEKIDVPKSRSRSLIFLPVEQMERLLVAASGRDRKSLRDRAILEVLFSTGLRVSELVSLNRDQVDLTQREFSVIGKGGRSRVVFLSGRAVRALKEYLNHRPDHFRPIFIRIGGAKPGVTAKDHEVRITPRSVERIVEFYRKKAGLPVGITPHGLRHSFATDLLRGGADLREVQELLGHKNVSTTQIYTHVTNRQLREVHERAHSGNR